MSDFTLGCGGARAWGIWVSPHDCALAPAADLQASLQKCWPTLEAPCPQSLAAGLQGQRMGSSLLVGAFVAACVKCFGDSEMLGQGDSHPGFSLPFCRVKLGRCLEFSPLSAPAP